MKQDFSEKTALKIMNTKLRGKPREAVYDLTDAELAVMWDNLESWTIGMSQILAAKVGDIVQTQKIIKGVMALPEPERVKLAEIAGATLERGEVPDDADFAAFILANNSDQLHVEDEIKRRENLL